MVAKLRRQAQAQRTAAKNNAEGDEAAEGPAGDDAGGAELSGAGRDEAGGEVAGEGAGNGLCLDGAPAPHPNFLRWWRLGALG